MLTCFLLLLLFHRTQMIIPDQIVFWPIKPFIFMSNNNTVDGILPKLYKRLKDLCSPNEELANFNLINFTQQQQFYNILKNTNYGTAELQYILEKKAVWFPVFRKPDNNVLEQKKLNMKLLLDSPGIAVIVNKKKITLIYKMFYAIVMSKHIGSIAFGFVVSFSALVWLVECINNKDFSKWFVRGFGTSLWWAVVSLATVGYGDIVPKSVIGRFLSTIWIIISIIIISSLTASFSSVITTNSFLSIRKEQVAVLKDSIDLEIVQKNFESTLLKDYSSFEEILKDINSNTANYGVLNIDVLMNMEFKTAYPDVSLVQLLGVKSPVLLMYGSDTNIMGSSNDNVSICINKERTDVLNNVIELYSKIPIIDIETTQSLPDLIMDNDYIKFPGIGVLCLIFVFIMKDIAQFTYYKCNGKKQKKIESNNIDVPLAVISNNHVNGEKKHTDISKDIAQIKEQIMKLNAINMYKQKCPVCSWQT
ncbi:uncharacterized protein LOC105847490 isoform X1 [Hydra vulgaris]|uniref:uncharacterized protein LOC105847490 isoform X1 n=1 Tax=Hydra vulgaris TaxID=6087 RepID=UPI00064165D0|nr:uncharacterized protein LOC105847490 [Hydra vulgaris]XP_047126930.1 uncharacterized protein LOC105847490 [Hydra vulgaris]